MKLTPLDFERNVSKILNLSTPEIERTIKIKQ